MTIQQKDNVIDLLFNNLFTNDTIDFENVKRVNKYNKIDTYRDLYTEGQVITQCFFGSLISRKYKIIKKYDKFCVCQFIDKGFYKFCMNYMDIYYKNKVKLY